MIEVEARPNRSRRRFVALGCLGVALAFAALSAAVVVLVAGTMKTSWAYTNGVELACRNPSVQEALGAPVEPRFWVTGSVEVTGPSGSADLAIPLRGPKGKATLYVVAEKRAGRWRFELLEAEVSGRADRIDLMPEESDDDSGGRPKSESLDTRSGRSPSSSTIAFSAGTVARGLLR